MNTGEMEQYLEPLKEFAVQYGLKIIGAIFILIIGRIIIGFLIRFLSRVMNRTNVDPTVASFLITFSRIALLAFVILAALSTVGVETTSIIAVLGAAGLAVGFALQGSLSNFASGIMLVTFRPIKAGDLVEIAGHLGFVKEVLIFNTFIKTFENKLVIIPNSKVTSDAIINYSAEGYLRCDMIFGISYGDDIDKAKKILVDIMENDPRVMKDPKFSVGVKTLNNSSVDFAVRPYVTVEDYWPVYFDTTEKVKKAFDAQGVTIPFPQRDVHLFQAAS